MVPTPTAAILLVSSTLLLHPTARALQPAAAAHASPTLESVMSFTTRGSPIASEYNHIAWVETTRGVANIYGAIEPDLKPLRITDFTADDAMEIELFGFYQQPSSSNPSHPPPAAITLPRSASGLMPATPAACTTSHVIRADTKHRRGAGGGELLIHFARRPSDGANPQHLCTPPQGGLYAVAWSEVGGGQPRLITSREIIDIRFGRLLFTQSVDVSEASNGNLGASSTPLAAVMMLKLSPSGDSITNPSAAPQHLFSTKHGSIGDVAWSPDGSLLAFSNDRGSQRRLSLDMLLNSWLMSAASCCVAVGNHGLIGIFNYTAYTHPDFPQGGSDPNALTWIEGTYEHDTWPHWSPSGTMLAFRRDRDMTGADGRDRRCTQHGYCGSAGPAFSMAVVDILHAEPNQSPRVGPARILFTDHRTGYPNGAAGYGSRGVWWHDSALLFASETSGWVHVIKVNASSHEEANASASVVDLTPQPCDNQAYQLHDGELYVTHNCDVTDSLGIAAINLATRHRRTIFAGQNHTIADAEAGLLFLKAGTVYIDTTITNSTTLRLIPADGSPTRALTPATDGDGFDASSFVKPQLVEFASGEFSIHGQLLTPPRPGSHSSSKGPAIIFTHGGCQRQMYAAFHYSGCYAALYTQNQHLASLGFTVLSINYRGGPGYGVKFRAANATGWEGAAEYQDVVRLCFPLLLSFCVYTGTHCDFAMRYTS